MAAAAIIMALQTVVSRSMAPSDAVVLTVGQIHSGTRFNIISGEAWMNGTTRCYSREIHDRLPGLVEHIAKSTAKAYGCFAEVEFIKITEVLINDPDMVEFCRKTVTELFGEEKFHIQPPTMGGEDFATYVKYVPGAFIRTGCGCGLPGGDLSNHCDHVFYNEDCLWQGTALLSRAALGWLKENTDKDGGEVKR